jgi:TfoX/Sxy family transcriptional regulator of competence genes
MAFNEELADRIRTVLGLRADISENHMFGGIAFLLSGNMFCGIVKDELMLRLGKEGAAAVLGEEHVREMDFTGRPMKTMVFIEPDGIEKDAELERWVLMGHEFAESLPPKS